MKNPSSPDPIELVMKGALIDRAGQARGSVSVRPVIESVSVEGVILKTDEAPAVDERKPI